MEEQMKAKDEQLAKELQKGKQGRAGGKILSLLGLAVAAVGVILGGNLVMIVIGAVILGLGQMVQSGSKGKANQKAFEAIVPALMADTFEGVDFQPAQHLLRAEDTNIPLPKHDSCSASGYIRGTYHGLPAELCTVRLTDVNEIQREETGMWERNETEVYTGQWMLCELGQEFPTWLTIWPREKLDKLLRSSTIQTGDEAFDKRFNLSSDNAQAALQILTPGRMERILALAGSAHGKFSLNLNADGRLYLAVHSGRVFFDIGKGREQPEILRQRFASELKWFTDMIDVFRPV